MMWALRTWRDCGICAGWWHSLVCPLQGEIFFNQKPRALPSAKMAIAFQARIECWISAWKAVCGLNSSQFFANHCPEAARSFVVSLTDKKFNINRKAKT